MVLFIVFSSCIANKDTKCDASSASNTTRARLDDGNSALQANMHAFWNGLVPAPHRFQKRISKGKVANWTYFIFYKVKMERQKSCEWKREVNIFLIHLGDNSYINKIQKWVPVLGHILIASVGSPPTITRERRGHFRKSLFDQTPDCSAQDYNADGIFCYTYSFLLQWIRWSFISGKAEHPE